MAIRTLSFVILLAVVCGCGSEPNKVKVENERVVLATTTSTYDTGLLDELEKVCN